jgi:LCP family protein required for cell wall assembly
MGNFRRRSAGRGTIRLALFLLVLPLLCLALAGLWVRESSSGRQPGQKAPVPVSGQPPAAPSATGESGRPGAEDPAVPTRPAASPSAPLPTPAPWTGNERVTVLVMGLDPDPDGPDGDVPRTDTMVLLSVDPLAKTAAMLSIPRDLWVYLPETGSSHKINTAYRWGELRDLEGGGPGQAMRSVSRLVGVPVEYYVLLDFNAFARLVDAMGGLDMHIREEITVDPLGPGNTVTLEPGVQTLSGAVALAYARNRRTENGTFDRAGRQQEVILAIRRQVLDFDMLPGLVARAPALYRQLSAGLRTNLTLDQAVRLAWLAAQVPDEAIRRSVFDLHKDFIYRTIETEGGPQDVLILRPERMKRLREEVFGEE